MQIEQGLGHDQDDCFKRGQGCAGLSTGGLKQGKTMRIQCPGSAQNHCPIQGFHAAEVIIDGRQIGVCPLGDCPKRHPVITMVGKVLFGRIKDTDFGGEGITSFCFNKTIV